MFRGRLELPTSGFSDQRSNQLSYLNLSLYNKNSIFLFKLINDYTFFWVSFFLLDILRTMTTSEITLLYKKNCCSTVTLPTILTTVNFVLTPLDLKDLHTPVNCCRRTCSFSRSKYITETMSPRDTCLWNWYLDFSKTKRDSNFCKVGLIFINYLV